jgi:hypothetical protein
MHEWLENGYGNRNNLQQWLDFIRQDIGAEADLAMLRDSDYLNSIGPYYYGPTGTQFHFTRFYTVENEPLTSLDIAKLYNFHKSPTMNRDLQKYYQARKLSKKTTRSREELLRDINMCIAVLNNMEELRIQQRYLQQYINDRKVIVEKKDLAAPDPAMIPPKPDKPSSDPSRFNLLQSVGLARTRHLEAQKALREYNRSMKIYFIRCREYDRACDRYKEALKEWHEQKESITRQCKQDVRDAGQQLKEVMSLISVYNDIIRRSSIHNDYQTQSVLKNFKHYLETGRADDLQGCMNIYEGERHWIDVKASQERIENTIYFINSDPEILKQAHLETNRLIASTIES